jgi:hypothetical protein
MQRARDGAELRWGGADTPVPTTIVPAGHPAPVTVAVSPVRPGQVVTVEYRVNGGPIRQAMALPLAHPGPANARLFRAVLPPQPEGLVEFLPVLRFAGQPISPGLGEAAEAPSYQVARAAQSDVTAAATPTGGPQLAGVPRWNWETRFLWTGSIGIRKEVVGALPDGLRINWYFTDGHFVGPDHAGTVMPGAADLMRIRTDGIGVVNVHELLQLNSGERIYCSYGGVFDLGPDGYARALRNEFDAFPPFVVTPTYATSAPALAWLNRTQCISVGRVDTKAMRIEYDVYAVQTGNRKPT